MVDKKVPYPSQAQRIAQALARHPDAPQGRGQQTWLVDEYKRRFGEDLHRQVISRYVNGDMVPRGERRTRLAQILGVDPRIFINSIGDLRARVDDIHAALSAEPDTLAIEMLSIFMRAAGWGVEQDGSGRGDIICEFGGRRYVIQVKAGVMQPNGSMLVSPFIPRPNAMHLCVAPDSDLTLVVLEVFKASPNRELIYKQVEGEKWMGSDKSEAHQLIDLLRPF